MRDPRGGTFIYNKLLSTNALPIAALMMIWPAAGAMAQDAKAGADAQKAAMQEKVAAVKQSLAANQKALQQYTWVETTEISMKGEVKKALRKECRLRK